jgi:UPF0716 protein FxsA
MFFKLFLLFTIIPFVEIALLIKIGTVIGTAETIMIIIITGLVGALMVRAAGIQCLFRIQENLRSGIVPTDELFTGLLILVSGAFLVTPGLITDAVGFVLLFPPTREIIKSYLKRYIKSKIEQKSFNSNIDIQF